MKEPQEILDKIVDVVLAYPYKRKVKKNSKTRRRKKLKKRIK